MKITKRQLRRIIREASQSLLDGGASLEVNYDSSGMWYKDPTTGQHVTPEELLDWEALGEDEFHRQAGEMVAAAATKAGITTIDDSERGPMSVDEFVQLMSGGWTSGEGEEVPEEVLTVAAKAGWAWDDAERRWKKQ